MRTIHRKKYRNRMPEMIYILNERQTERVKKKEKIYLRDKYRQKSTSVDAL
jgi:hypothetical protein